MHYRSVKGVSGLGQLGILIAFTIVGFLLAGIVQLIIAMSIAPAGVSLSQMGEEAIKAFSKPENVNAARLAQVLGTFFLLFVPSVLYLLVVHGKNSFWIGFNKYVNYKQILIGFILIFLANTIAVPLSEITRKILMNAPHWNSVAAKMEGTYSDQVTVLSHLKSWPEFLMALVIMAFFPAMFEEIYFRGVLQNILVRWWKAPMIGIIVTSIVFSSIHLSIYLFLSRIVLGFILGYMYQRSKNLWVNIIAHFLNNAIALSQLFWYSMHEKPINVDKMDPNISYWGGLIAVGITFGLFYVFEIVSSRNRQKAEDKEQELLSTSSPYQPFPEN